jgi:hypothetical protein
MPYLHCKSLRMLNKYAHTISQRYLQQVLETNIDPALSPRSIKLEKARLRE